MKLSGHIPISICISDSKLATAFPKMQIPSRCYHSQPDMNLDICVVIGTKLVLLFPILPSSFEHIVFSYDANL